MSDEIKPRVGFMQQLCEICTATKERDEARAALAAKEAEVGELCGMYQDQIADLRAALAASEAECGRLREAVEDYHEGSLIEAEQAAADLKEQIEMTAMAQESCDEMQTRAEAAESERDELRAVVEGVREWAKEHEIETCHHLDNCGLIDSSGDCDCGVGEIRAILAAKVKS